MISLASVKGGAGAAASTGDVTIRGFAFGPGRITVPAGKSVTWVNDDTSPHQVTITTGSAVRGPVMTRGQAYTHAFPTPGVYDYICGLHPQMKGQVEVR